MACRQLGMVVIVWAFSFVSSVFGFEEQASAIKVSSQDKRDVSGGWTISEILRMRVGCQKLQGREKDPAKVRGEQAAEKPVPRKTGVGARNQ